ncbi:MAG: hypothetical protein HN377_06840 [Alphaproteobacteria bacterium]|jgi:hypothetical protein|nr:hypothetical protein [Alphaproteobacteria bacterium]
MRNLGVLAILAILGGCSAIPGIAEVQGAIVVGTDKTMEDHVVSLVSGKDCSTVRKENDLTYCVEDEPVIKQNIFCYKTLASVTCYDRPDPNPGRQRVDLNEHNTSR